MTTKAKRSSVVPPATSYIRYTFISTSIAELLVASNDLGLIAIIMRERPDEEGLVAELQGRFPDATLRYAPAAMKAAAHEIAGFVEKPRTNIALPLDIRATAFQRSVYDHVLTIPFGTTTSFSAVAEAIGSPRAIRAVGTACTRNPLEFAIPCHRVLRSDGSYSGGSPWGDRRQETLVRRERAARDA